MTDRSKDSYSIRREELELILHELCSVIGELKFFLSEDRRSSSTIKQVDEIDF